MKKKKELTGIIITQSIMKDLRRYIAKTFCGLVLKAKYFDYTWPREGDDSPAKKLGRYFEYILTGAIPRDGEIPKAEYMKTAIARHGRDPLRNRLEVKDMKKPYQLAHKNAERVRRYFKIMKIHILEVNVYIRRGLRAGTIDIIAEYNGHRVVIDVKYSGLLFDKWEELGWEWSAIQRKFHGTQALQYHSLTKAPFYFLVVSSTNAEDIKFLDVQFDQWSIEQHDLEVDKTRTDLQFMVDFNKFNALPELVRCSKCAIREGCKARIDAPVPKKVYLVDEDD